MVEKLFSFREPGFRVKNFCKNLKRKAWQNNKIFKYVRVHEHIHYQLGPVYMRGGTGRLPRRDVYRLAFI